MTRKEIVLSKLVEVPEKDWAVIATKCREHIKIKLKCKTLFGAHSISNLGMPAEQYYFQNAVLKLYEPKENKGWDWKFEEYTLLEQIIRIINSMISEEVRKVKTAKAQAVDIIYSDNEVFLENFDDSLSVEEVLEREDKLQNFMNQVAKAIEGDEDLEMLYLYLLEGKTYDEITVEMKLDNKKKLYKLVERLKETVQRYAASVNSNGNKS